MITAARTSNSSFIMSESQNQKTRCCDLIDGVLVINLDSSPQRLETFMSQTGALFPQGKVERISAVMGRELPGYGAAPWFTEHTGERARFWGGTAGCALSHRKALEYARDRGWKNVLIFEDDARLLDEPDMWGLLADAITRAQGRYLLYWGFNKPVPLGRKWLKGEKRDVWQVDGVIAAHAYLVPASMYDLLLSYLPTEENVWEWLSIYKAVDVVYRDFVPMHAGVNVYAVYPVVCLQSDQFSFIGQTAADGASMMCTEPPRSIYSLKAVSRFWCPWLQMLKNKLNSIRTHRRALKGGLPGYRKPKK